MEQDLLHAEFKDYQMLLDEEILMKVRDQARIREGDTAHLQIDVIWHYLSSLKLPIGLPRSQRLSKVAKLILVIPHSNAAGERIFSIIRKNKTSFRPNLDPKGTLSSILTIKC